MLSRKIAPAPLAPPIIGDPVQISVGALNQGAFGIGALVSVKLDQRRQRAIQRDSEDRAEAIDATKLGCTVQVTVARQEQPAGAIVAVVPASEGVKGRECAIGSQLEYRPRAVGAADIRRAVKVASEILRQGCKQAWPRSYWRTRTEM